MRLGGGELLHVGAGVFVEFLALLHLLFLLFKGVGALEQRADGGSPFGGHLAFDLEQLLLGLGERAALGDLGVEAGGVFLGGEEHALVLFAELAHLGDLVVDLFFALFVRGEQRRGALAAALAAQREVARIEVLVADACVGFEPGDFPEVSDALFQGGGAVLEAGALGGGDGERKPAFDSVQLVGIGAEVLLVVAEGVDGADVCQGAPEAPGSLDADDKLLDQARERRQHVLRDADLERLEGGVQARQVVVEFLALLRQVAADDGAERFGLGLHLGQALRSLIEHRDHVRASLAEDPHRQRRLAGAVFHAGELVGDLAEDLVAGLERAIRARYRDVKRLECLSGIARAAGGVEHVHRQLLEALADGLQAHV